MLDHLVLSFFVKCGSKQQKAEAQVEADNESQEVAHLVPSLIVEEGIKDKHAVNAPEEGALIEVLLETSTSALERLLEPNENYDVGHLEVNQ